MMGWFAHGFVRNRAGMTMLVLDKHERAELVQLLGQLQEFIAPAEPDPNADPLFALVGIDDSVATPDDPALLRLLPDAYPDDDEASLEFRRFTERSLRDAKLAAATRARDSLARDRGPIVIDAADAQAWLTSLNDMRLIIGTRLGVSDDDDELDAGPDPADAITVIYHWLGGLQATLIDVLMSAR